MAIYDLWSPGLFGETHMRIQSQKPHRRVKRR